ncbi:MAG: hypothetical protein JXR48_04105 [Candidatus Delongbacteria bacterium]|nr:hypothetical protein [Candidatus Delongbacteria bacterium]MBN2834129.1 hypothetical protein [Candidatus Delongbacteria bacterium]
MPICEINCLKGVLSTENQNYIAMKLTEILLEAEGLPDNAISRSICQITFNESEKVYVGGKLAEFGKIVIKIFVFAEAYSEDQKADLYTKIVSAFKEINTYTRQQEGRNIWCLVMPVGLNNFGVGGFPVSLDITKKIVGS